MWGQVVELTGLTIAWEGEAPKREKMVGETGVEPAPSWSRTKRATRLRYSPNRHVKRDKKQF